MDADFKGGHVRAEGSLQRRVGHVSRWRNQRDSIPSLLGNTTHLSLHPKPAEALDKTHGDWEVIEKLQRPHRVPMLPDG